MNLPPWASAPCDDAQVRSYSDTDVVWQCGDDIKYQFKDELWDALAPVKRKLAPRIALGAGLVTLGAVATEVFRALT